MIVWKRKGMLVFVAIMLAMGTYALIVHLLGLNESLGVNKALPTVMMYGFFLPALYNHILTVLFTKNEKSEIVTNQEGKQFKIDNYSSLFFIRNKYWTYILLILYIVIAFFIYKTLYYN